MGEWPASGAAAPARHHALSADEVLRRLESERSGLSEEAVRERLARVGPNRLRTKRPASAWKILADQLKSVVVLLLIAAAAVSVSIGDVLEAASIGVVLVLNTVLGFVTEIRARRAMEALLRLEVPRAVVCRAGTVREIDARELVPGDVVVLEAGQSVPADARLLEATDLTADEAPLTGESVPVTKSVEAVAADTTLPERADMVFKGTTVTTGSAHAVVVATGMATELGRIGELVAAIPDEPTPLERRLDALGRRLVWLALGVGAVVAALGWLRGVAVGDMVTTGIALAIAAVPEGLPAVATIALAVGLRRMVRRHALVRRLPSVETLGSVTAICTDKTGTLTAGQMTVTVVALAEREIEVSGAGYEPRGSFSADGRETAPSDDPVLTQALRVALLANRAGVEQVDGEWVVRGDPTEAALLVLAGKAGLSREEVAAGRPEVGEVPFSSARKLMATFHREDGGRITSYVKGAPERIVDLCSRVLTDRGEAALDEPGRDALRRRNQELASRGLRVLALACGETGAADESALRDLTFVGFTGAMDPAAAGVRETIEVFRGAGIRTVMLTGDQRPTAEAVARDLGIVAGDDRVLDGRAIAGLDEAELAERMAGVAAISRVSPEDKLKIVAAYQGRGEIVAMLGDGVNDAAALRRADVGVAMGIRGTDVAKEAASVVLQDDRFATIGAAIEEGRVIFDNIRKFVFYLFSCNLAEVLVLLIAGVVGLPLPLRPLQILWLNLVTDTLPALALALEPAEPGIMRRPPRPPKQAIVSGRFLRAVGFYSGLITAVTLVAFVAGLGGGDADTSRAVTMCFVTLGLAQGFHLGNARARGPVLAPRMALGNLYAVGALAAVVLLQVAAVELPPLAAVLQTTPLSARDWLFATALAAVPAVIGQLLKRLRRGGDGVPPAGNRSGHDSRPSSSESR